MVISKQHKYVFVEIPLTASWAIRNELVKFYDGVPILHKHATYQEFADQADRDERAYFAFATVRNPLDEAVSRYFKLKTDHHGAFTDPEAIEGLKSDMADRLKFAFVREGQASFAAYFQHYHRRPFNNVLALSESELDYVMRFEKLQAEFRELLGRLGLEAARPVPVQNKTALRQADWQGYYSPNIVPQAKRCFGPFMRKWGYSFPEEWGESKVNWRAELTFRAWSAGQKAYIRHLRYNQSAVGRMGRAIRARLIR